MICKPLFTPAQDLVSHVRREVVRRWVVGHPVRRDFADACPFLLPEFEHSPGLVVVIRAPRRHRCMQGDVSNLDDSVKLSAVDCPREHRV